MTYLVNMSRNAGVEIVTHLMKIQSKKCLVNIGILRNAKEGWVGDGHGNLILSWCSSNITTHCKHIFPSSCMNVAYTKTSVDQINKENTWSTARRITIVRLPS